MIFTDNKKTLLTVDASNQDIINDIHKYYPIALQQVINSKFYERFNYGSAERDAKAVWLFLKKYITYKKDPDHSQLLRLPGRFINDKNGDCKSYSIFSAAILGALGYKVAFRYTNYLPNAKNASHVYIYLPDHNIIIDGCYKYFNKEKIYTFVKNYEMNNYVLSGINGRQERRERRQERRERRQERREERKEGGKGGGRGVKRVALAPGRAAFLALVAINFRGLAKRLANAIKREPAKSKDKWEKLGGNFSKLEKAVNKGKDKRPLLGQSDKNKNLEGLGTIDPATVAIITAAAPVIISIIGFLKTITGDSEAGGNIDLSDIPANENADDYTVTDSESGMLGNKTMLIIGAAAIAAFLLFKKK